MKIVFILPSVHTNILGWIHGLIALGHDVTLDTVRPNRKKTGEAVGAVGASHHQIAPTESWLRLRQLRFLRDQGRRWFVPDGAYKRHLVDRNADVVVVRPYSVPLAITAWKAVRKSGGRLVLYEQHDPRPLRRWIRDVKDPRLQVALAYGSIRLRLLGWFLGAAVISPVVWTDMSQALDDPRVVPFAPPPFGNPPRDQSKSRQGFNILVVARFQPRKRHDVAIEAVETLLDNGHDINLAIVGHSLGRDDEACAATVQARVEASSHRDRITISHNIPPEQMVVFYAQNDILVLPAEREPASVAVIEALAAGLPVIVSDSCGTAGYVGGNQRGMLMREADVADLTEKLTALADDRLLLAALGSRAATFATDFLMPNFVAARLLAASGLGRQRLRRRRAPRSARR